MHQTVDANTLIDERQIIATLHALVNAFDQKSWQNAEALFTPKVRLCVGGPPLEVTPRALVTQWRSVLARCETTLHFLSNHLVIVRGNTAESSSSVVGLHLASESAGKSHLVTFGTFQHELLRQDGLWKIEALSFCQLFSLGNAELLVH
jgi:hypothetical protein